MFTITKHMFTITKHVYNNKTRLQQQNMFAITKHHVYNNKTHVYNNREMFYLTTHSTHFIYGYMTSDIWLRTILIVRKETRCRHIGYCFRLTARVLLYAPSHRQDSTYHGLCYTSRGALAVTRNSSMGPPHEGIYNNKTHVYNNKTHVYNSKTHVYNNKTHVYNNKTPCLQ